MKITKRILTAAFAVAVLASPAAWAADDKATKNPAASPKSAAPARIDAEVVAVNPAAGTMTVRMSDGSTQEFRGNQDTLKDYKVGDKIEGKLRPQTR
jgi:polyisoprenoid-binding protein YceI